MNPIGLRLIAWKIILCWYKVQGGERAMDGKITRFMTRWVVKNYFQLYGIDYDQTIAAVVKPMPFRIL